MNNIIQILTDARRDAQQGSDDYLARVYDATLTLISERHNQELEVLETLLYTKEIQQHINKPYMQKHPTRIPIVVDKSDTIFSYPIGGSADFLPIPKYEFTELVDKSSEQKIAFKVLPIPGKAEEIKNYLIQYLTEKYPHIKPDVSLTEIMDNGYSGYELIAFNSIVENTDERIKFIEEFKKYLDGIDKQLPLYIIMNNTFTDNETYDYWKSVNALRTAEMFDLSREKLVNVIDSGGIKIIIESIDNSGQTNIIVPIIKKIPQKINIEYIYLIKEREFIKTNENIYKLGKSRQTNCRRIASYPKGSQLITIVPCSNCTSMEKTLLKQFRKIFIPRTEIGSEYFEGDLQKMLEMLHRESMNNLIC